MKLDNDMFYIYLYKLFKQKSNNRIFISFHCVREVMRRRLHKIPRCLHYIFLKEMEQLKLIKRVGSQNGKNISYLTNGEGLKNLTEKEIDDIIETISKNIKFELVGGDIDNLLNQFNLPI